ncbi:sulfotransferase [Ideonella azotifigens]|uniref:Carrier domain-containing protein n=1 Tax=Ideonella azotifigens TaxID=513160 RepID=A0ABN1KF09_9BURK|nr:sulfotransferase [Ideonella azotifigens]MCD2340761.1 sulfotransferase [Ideonella azotifigens]
MHTVENVEQRVIGVISDLTEDWDVELEGGIGPQTTMIGDIGFASIDFIQLVVAIEGAYKTKLGFQDLLMKNGAYVEDLSVAQIAEFVAGRLNGSLPVAAPAPVAANTAVVATRLTSIPESERVTPEKLAKFRASIATRKLRDDGTPKNPPALFVLSPPRSGSTLLRVILAGSSKLFAPPELHLLPYNTMGERLKALSGEHTEHLLDGTVRALMQLHGWEPEAARAFVSKCEADDMSTKAFYNLLQQPLKGEKLLVDKTPSYVIDVDILKRIEQDFDRPLYIHLTRHPLGMIRSYEESKLQRLMPMVQEASFGSRELAELTWLTAQQNTVAAGQHVPADRWLQIQYEDIVCNPSASIEKICSFAGIPYEDAMINPYQEMDQRMTDGVDNASKMSGDLKFHLHNAINPDAAVRWKQFYSEDILGAQTREVAASLGY